MTDPAIIAASYAAERNYSHNPDDVIDASDAVGAWGTAKESTTKLVDLSGNGNIADIHGPMPAEGFIQGRRFDGVDDYLDCGNNLSLDSITTIDAVIYLRTLQSSAIISKLNDTYTLSYGLDVLSTGNVQFDIRNDNLVKLTSTSKLQTNKYYVLKCVLNNGIAYIYINGALDESGNGFVLGNSSNPVTIGKLPNNLWYTDGNILYVNVTNNTGLSFNTLAVLPFWSVNYTDYPDNVTEYTDNLPYSSSIISSGTFKVDDDKLQCVSAGTITYSASYEFDGSEYIKVKIGGVEYAGTGTITQGNTTVSVAQGSNKVTIVMGTADTINGIDIQFRAEV